MAEIPKIVHYCWFGKQAMPKMLQTCVSSWKEHLPDYKFILWNEDNSVLDCEFVKRAYEEKIWAYVSDYIRLKAVYEHGGIYLDTDMLLFKPLDNFLNQDCFFVAEHIKSIGMGIFGTTKEHFFLKLCLEKYQEKFTGYFGIPGVVNTVFRGYSKYKGNYEENVYMNGVVIYAPKYFYALPYAKYFDIHHYKNYVTTESYGVHLWHGSWHDYNELALLRRKEYGKAIRQLYVSLKKGKLKDLRYVKRVMIAFRDGFMTKNAFK